VPDSCNADGVPIALTVAGSDSGGGAGIQADLKAFSALGVYGASVVTAVTAQNTRAVTAVHAIPTEVIAAQLDAVFDDLKVAAVKVGMLGDPRVIATVAQGLKGFGVPVVLDPVMVAKSGDALLPDSAVIALRRDLLPLADLLTPNLPEAARLLEAPAADGGAGPASAGARPPGGADEGRPRGRRLLHRSAAAARSRSPAPGGAATFHPKHSRHRLHPVVGGGGGARQG
jgi:hydroxymethylpyrimidine/phosphomethylpyrimidine kinase